jgi:uncharacterized protein
MLAAVQVTLDTSIQSNLLLVNDEWIDVLKEHFRGGIGSSFDWGLRTVRGSWPVFRDRWLRKYWECREAGIGVGVITVVNRACIDAPDEVYDFFSELGCGFETYPMAPLGAGNGKATIGTYGIGPEEYGRWQLAVWGRYCADPAPRTRPMFVHRLARALALGETVGNHMPGDCAGGNLVVSADGTVSYCPALAGSREHLYGNVFDSGLDMLLQSPIRAAVFRRQVLLPLDCRDCAWSHLCHGGCPSDALAFTGDAANKDPFCAAYRLLFQRIGDDIARGVLPVPLRSLDPGGTAPATDDATSRSPGRR